MAYYVGALSFEPRALSGLFDRVKDGNGRLSDAILLDYGSSATTGLKAAQLRDACWQRAKSFCGQNGIDVQRVAIDGSSSRALMRILLEVLTDGNSEFTFDISCLTKPHLLALARTLAASKARNWSVSYSSPAGYGDVEQPRQGWKDVLLLPLGRDSNLDNQGMALGLVLLGHEPSRLSIAMEELEPSSGMALLSHAVDRPDIHRMTLRKNASILTHLEALSARGPRALQLEEVFGTPGWKMRTVDVSDPLDSIMQHLAELIAAARGMTPTAPIILYPFGPKHIVFLAAIALSHAYPSASWAVCPIHKTHSINYSEGVGKTYQIRSSAVWSELNTISGPG